MCSQEMYNIHLECLVFLVCVRFPDWCLTDSGSLDVIENPVALEGRMIICPLVGRFRIAIKTKLISVFHLNLV